QVLTTMAAAAAGALIRPIRILARDHTPQSIKFAVIGDWGSGDREETSVVRQLMGIHTRSPLDFVVTAGDNIYPNGSGRYFPSRFETPFAELIRQRVNFYTVLGNHDVKEGRQDQSEYPDFNMGGSQYYSFKKGDGLAEFFMLDSNDFSREQADWLDRALAASSSPWKIAVFHHPIYSSGKWHGSDLKLRKDLEPILNKYSVPLAFSGHDHIYERVLPQNGVTYFVTGNSGKVRRNDVRRDSGITAASFDKDNSFMILEIDRKKTRYTCVCQNGETVDEGEINAGG
ncbi:MAG TPA: metallophosphoesterase, partial [Blastocatellia bacterium]|nr:metallophosphoesterase [Blastocatellia bacterium]